MAHMENPQQVSPESQTPRWQPTTTDFHLKSDELVSNERYRFVLFKVHLLRVLIACDGLKHVETTNHGISFGCGKV